MSRGGADISTWQVLPTRSVFLQVNWATQECYACLLGVALIGKVGSIHGAHTMYQRRIAGPGRSPRRALGRMLGVSLRSVDAVSRWYSSGMTLGDVSARLAKHYDTK